MVKKIIAKKHLGQHFLKDENIAKKIADALTGNNYSNILEVGPGMGALTKYLEKKSPALSVVEIDRECVAYLRKHFTGMNIIEGDFLSMNFKSPPFGRDWKGAVIGNFPYNISSQILFKTLDYKNQVPEIIGMFQKEVAERIAAKPKTKSYGILSVLLQTYYNIEYLFTVNEKAFSPPPKVKSAVVRLTRNNVESLGCDEELFQKVIKIGFNQRRKMLRNSVRPLLVKGHEIPDFKFSTQRPEELSVSEFVELTNFISSQKISALHLPRHPSI